MVETETDLAPLVVRLRHALSRRGLLGDEKQWTDRAIHNSELLQNVVDRLESTNEDDERPTESKQTICRLLHECFAPVDEELQIISRPPSDFSLQENSLLAHALQAISERPSCESPYWQSIHSMTLEALSSFQHLCRLIKLPSRIPLRDCIGFRYMKNGDTTGIIDEAVGLCSSGRPFLSRLEDTSTTTYFAVRVDPQQAIKRGVSTVLPMPEAIFVPGGRFREGYYWDTYWMMRGLCCAGKVYEARDMLRNFFSCIDRFGFVPNGFRSYYLDRSQPPLLSECVLMVFEMFCAVDNSREAFFFLWDAFPRLLVEYFGFWMNPSTGHLVWLDESHSSDTIEHQSKDHETPPTRYLNRYYSQVPHPRSESHLKDEEVERDVDELLKTHPERIAAGTSSAVMQGIRAACESGWDFSSRWAKNFVIGTEHGHQAERDVVHFDSEVQRRVFKDNKLDYFRQIDTINVLPVDLNAILYRVELNLCRMAKILGDDQQNILDSLAEIGYTRKYSQGAPIIGHVEKLKIIEEGFKSFADQRRTTMKQLMWDSSEKVWRDYYMRTQTQSKVISAASVIALWAGLSDDENIPIDIHPSLFKFWSIVPTKYLTGCQWDSPNVWPPLVHFAVEYLDRSRAKWDFSDLSQSHSDHQTKYFKLSGDAFYRYENRSGVHHREEHIMRGRELASAFLFAAFWNFENCHAAQSEGAFFEKYNALNSRTEGGGGEYPNQIGFGWTNGVIIEFISRYQDTIIVPTTSQTEQSPLGIPPFQFLTHHEISLINKMTLQNQ